MLAKFSTLRQLCAPPWSLDLGLEVSGVYVQYEDEGSLVRATNVFAALRGEGEITDAGQESRR
jgi:hypothetical protein